MSRRASRCLLGIDNGLTVTKAVVFDANGSVLSVAHRRLPQMMPAPRFVERDMAGLWVATAEAVAQALAMSGRPDAIAAVAETAHGDGLYLLDGDLEPLGSGILSLKSRAGAVLDGWQADGTASRTLAVTAQMPHVSAPATLLAWMRELQPERFARIARVLDYKDWLRFGLIGTIGTRSGRVRLRCAILPR